MNRPPRSQMLPLYRPWVGREETEAVAEVLASGWIGMGAKVQEFERQFAALVGAKHAVSVNSCTAGLHLSLVAANIGAGDEVITTPYTFTATSEAIHHAGATVRFADIDPRTLNLTPETVERAITPKTKAVVPVHIAGLPCDMDGLMRLAEKRGLFLLDDAAHAVVAEIGERRIGSVGHASAFSFYPTKNLTTGEGGMVTTNDDAFAERLRRIRYHGLNRDTWARRTTRQPWAYDVLEQGYKCNITDIQAAMGLAQIAKLDLGRKIRDHIAARYREAFADLPEIRLPAEPENGRHAWHLYIIQLEPEQIDRDAFITELNARKIGTGVHYIPLHFLTHYRNVCGVKEGDFPNAERAFRRVVSIPFWPGMDDEDTDDVIDAVTSILEAGKHGSKDVEKTGRLERMRRGSF